MSIDGKEPTSAVAEEAVAEIKKIGGAAVANANSVAEMAGGASTSSRAQSTPSGRIDGVNSASPASCAKAHAFTSGRGGLGSGHRDAPEGTFTVFRAAAAAMREQKSGTPIGFTSGRVRGLGRAGELRGEEGRHRAVGAQRRCRCMHRYGVTVNCIAPVARARA